VKKFLKRLIERIYLSFNDNLVYFESITRCKSRFYYDTVVCKYYESKECVVVFIDINNLKNINDTFGHCYGTQYIKKIADQLRALPDTYEVCRIGGDEFAIIGNTEFTDVGLKQIQGISYGLVHKRKRDSFHYIVQRADQEMYKMKRAMKES
jgi:diguanylate cyclase (GGDEF)-like protein